MAVSAFKSSSRRSNPTNSSTPFITKQNTDKDNSPNKAPLRRSRSVSAFSRSSLDSSSESFLNKRDNPLFWATESQTVEPQNPVKPTKDSKPTTPAAADTRRGRSASRISDVLGTRKDVGRSLSRVDTGRRNRSVSRCPDSRRHSVISKSEEEQEFGSLKKGGTDGKNVGLVRSSSDALDQLKGLRTWSSQHSSIQSSNGSDANLSCLQSLNWENGVSTASSLSGAEEKTIKAVCEQMNMNRAHSCDHLSVQGNHLEDDTSTTSSSIYETVRTEVRRAIYEIQNDLESAMQRSNTPTLASTDITDIPPDLVNPSAVELVLDIRREYAKKLEQSQERARKLRSDLAVEEHREQELSRILKEVLPDPKTSNAPKSRPGRKASIERRKMSKRLTEEAIAYFDECVSLSTFDSSDFSSPEDPPLNLIGITTPVSKSASLLQANSSASVTSSSNRCLNDKQELSIENQFTSDGDAPGLMASSGPREPALNKSSPKSANIAQDCKFSFAHKPTETPELQQDIRKYIRNFEKGIGKDELDLRVVRSKCYDIGEYNLQDAAQSYMFDRVIFRNRIESGGILLCGGGISSSFSPFASFV